MNTPEILKIYGPPGTGKTYTLLKLLEEHIADGTHPKEVGFFSFTRKAALEAGERAARQFGYTKKDLEWFSTLHAMCFRSLGLSTSQVMEGHHLLDFSRKMKIALTIRRFLDSGQLATATKHDQMLFLWNLSRITGQEIRELHRNYTRDNKIYLSLSETIRLGQGMEAYKEAKGLVDYTDMLDSFILERPIPPIKVLFVDEAQDLSLLQWDVVKVLSEQVSKVYIAGDDDQAIFRWAGASPGAFNRFPGKVRILEQSYRIPLRVHDLAGKIIKQVVARQPKDYLSRSELGTVFRHVTLEQAIKQLDFSKSILFLARNNVHLEPVVVALQQHGCVFRGERSTIPTKEMEALEGWIRLLLGQTIPIEQAVLVYSFLPSKTQVKYGFKKKLESHSNSSESISLRRLIQDFGLIWNQSVTEPVKALSRLSPDSLLFVSKLLHQCSHSLEKALERLSRGDQIRVSTIHGAKGAEADQVVLIPDMTLRTYNSYLHSQEDEHRVYYVGVTRAKETLFILRPFSKLAYPL